MTVMPNEQFTLHRRPNSRLATLPEGDGGEGRGRPENDGTTGGSSQLKCRCYFQRSNDTSREWRNRGAACFMIDD
ncbi:hypothetical protein BIW11_03308 [Tropilaelaps mercedesae]|uniref:Uncharacterized protein n=1 Tax=Tropilaelaps mercedesae TaxID=418985 RepID=A0A1V9XNN7_9ACAR|nr:hypothetical protein BIW11_03308 [Tropilaelaps mercedesae]